MVWPERRSSKGRHSQGKALTGALSGFRSLRAVGQRYRIIYRVVSGEVQVYVVAVGLRQEGSKRDVYRLFGRLVDRIGGVFGW